MSRACVALCVLLCLGGGAGCRMCASPYDYCGPTYGVENCDDGCGQGIGCSMTDRRGSVLSQGGWSGAGDYGGDYYADGYQVDEAMPNEQLQLDEQPMSDDAPAEDVEIDPRAYQPPAYQGQPVYRSSYRSSAPAARMRPTPDPRNSYRMSGGPSGAAMMIR